MSILKKICNIYSFMINNINDRQIFVQGSINSAFKTWLCKKKSITWSWILPETQTLPQQITKFPLILWHPKFLYSIYSASQLTTILTQMIPAHNLQSYFSKFHFNIFLLPVPILSNWFFLSDFSSKTVSFLYLNVHRASRKILLHIRIELIRN